jgi:hypothetical protein
MILSTHHVVARLLSIFMKNIKMVRAFQWHHIKFYKILVFIILVSETGDIQLDTKLQLANLSDCYAK